VDLPKWHPLLEVAAGRMTASPAPEAPGGQDLSSSPAQRRGELLTADPRKGTLALMQASAQKDIKTALGKTALQSRACQSLFHTSRGLRAWRQCQEPGVCLFHASQGLSVASVPTALGLSCTVGKRYLPSSSDADRMWCLFNLSGGTASSSCEGSALPLQATDGSEALRLVWTERREPPAQPEAASIFGDDAALQRRRPEVEVSVRPAVVDVREVGSGRALLVEQAGRSSGKRGGSRPRRWFFWLQQEWRGGPEMEVMG
jgi:hypothetical protein